MRIGNSGQALVEFAYFSVFSASFVAIAGLILKEEWNRSKCAYLVFENTHNYLISRNASDSHDSKLPLPELNHWRSSKPGFTFHVEEIGHCIIIGTGQCGRHIEKVRLPKLESARW